MYRVLYQDESVTAVGIVEESSLIGLIVTFKNLLSRHLYFKTNSNMFVYKGRWFQGEIEKDDESTLYMNVSAYGYILVDGLNAIFKEIHDIERL